MLAQGGIRHPTVIATPTSPAERSDSAVKLLAGAVLYGAMLALLYATFVLIRASRRQREHSMRRSTPSYLPRIKGRV